MPARILLALALAGLIFASFQRYGPATGIVIDREPADTDGVIVLDCNYSNPDAGCGG